MSSMARSLLRARESVARETSAASNQVVHETPSPGRATSSKARKIR